MTELEITRTPRMTLRVYRGYFLEFGLVYRYYTTYERGFAPVFGYEFYERYSPERSY